MAALVAAIGLGRGLRIPADLSIAEPDDAPIASLMWPQLTTIRQRIKGMAGKAVERLLEFIRAGRSPGGALVAHDMATLYLQARESMGRVSG